MKETFKKLSPNLMVEDVNGSIDFYCDVLGFAFVLGAPEAGGNVVRSRDTGRALGWALVRKGAVDIMFQTRQSLVQENFDFAHEQIGGSLTLFIEVEDIDAFYGLIKDRVDIVRDMETTFYGMKEFIIRDNNGYILTFAQRG